MLDTRSETEIGQLSINLEEAIGPEHVIRSPEAKIDGLRPALLAMPGSGAEAALCLRICSRFGARVVPAGSMTWLECGNPVRSVDVVLSLSRMGRVVDYNPADLTIRAEAGIAMSDLDRITKQEKQWLPLDAPGQGTLGAVVACGSSGPLRFGYGAPRDYVIGLRLAHVDGTQSKSGGQVVKNVAGYDLNKLYIGSYGTLAVITEVILKLRPAPEASATVLATASECQSLYAIASRVMSGRLRPVSVFVLNRTMSSRIGLAARGGAMLVRFVESEAAVSDQVDRLRDLLSYVNCELATAQAADDELWPKVASLDASGEVALKASVAVSGTAWAQASCEDHFPECIAAADMGMGVVRLSIGGGDLELVNRIKLLRAEIESKGGTLIIERAPAFIRLEADAWGDPGPAINIMRSIKQSFDPHSLLSPGRFVSGM